MRSQLFVAAGAAVVSAAEILERQDDACQSALAENENLINDLPKLPDTEEWLSFALEQDHAMTASGLCEIPVVTGSPDLVSSFSAYVAEVTSWVGEYSDGIQSLYSVCADNDVFNSLIGYQGLPIDGETVCTEFTYQTISESSAVETATVTTTVATGSETTSIAEETGDASASESEAEASESAAESAAASESGDDEGAAPRQTGMAVAAVAVAGVAAMLL